MIVWITRLWPLGTGIFKVHPVILKPEQFAVYENCVCAAAWDRVEVVSSKTAIAAKVIAKFRVFTDFLL